MNDLSALIRRAIEADATPPFSDQSLVDLRTGARTTIVVPGGVALVTTAGSPGPAEAELVVDPPERGHGVGTALVAEVLREVPGELLVWAHGDQPAARALAARFGFDRVRELLELRTTEVRPHGRPAVVEPFRPGVDDAEWLRVNAASFADHPEQGRMTQADLDARMAEPWFRPEDLLVARAADGSMQGFCWLKVEHGVGEFYAVAVAPEAQGRGLGRGLVDAGLDRLREADVSQAALYVEADNTAAVALYRSVGFTDHAVDVQYRRAG